MSHFYTRVIYYLGQIKPSACVLKAFECFQYQLLFNPWLSGNMDGVFHSSAWEQTALTQMRVSKILSGIGVHSGSSTTLLFTFKI